MNSVECCNCAASYLGICAIPGATMTRSKLRHTLFWLLGELSRPQNRPTLRFANSSVIQKWVLETLQWVLRLKPLQG